MNPFTYILKKFPDCSSSNYHKLSVEEKGDLLNLVFVEQIWETWRNKNDILIPITDVIKRYINILQSKGVVVDSSIQKHITKEVRKYLKQWAKKTKIDIMDFLTDLIIVWAEYLVDYSDDHVEYCKDVIEAMEITFLDQGEFVPFRVKVQHYLEEKDTTEMEKEFLRKCVED